MIVLGIETSCDETALALIDAKGDKVKILANLVLSQATLHAKYGGVFPNLAKREHANNLIPLLTELLKEAKMLTNRRLLSNSINPPFHLSTENVESLEKIRMILAREPQLMAQFEKFIPTIKKPPIDLIAVTYGPGLEPALWVGINFAKALSQIWHIPVSPINHLEGHIVSTLIRRDRDDEFAINNLNSEKNKKNQTSNQPGTTSYRLHAIKFPALALLISGGHTALVLITKLGKYEIIGETKDDAVGEAFDKTARILGLPYPGGKEISRLAEQARARKKASNSISSLTKSNSLKLPRPMLHSGDYNFSFSGLKTAVLYAVKKIPLLTQEIKEELAREFEDAITEVLISKTTKAIREFETKTLIIAGGVVANNNLRSAFSELHASAFPKLELLIPEISHATDNALMIAIAAYLQKNTLEERFQTSEGKNNVIVAAGRARL
jgi:N6-L-threonylcarbamoyladenine synthase